MFGSTLGATIARASATVVAAATLIGCASTKLDAQWVDPQFAGRSLRGASVLVLCDAAEPVVKRICQDQVAAQVTALGATPVIGPDVVNSAPGRTPLAGQYLPAARAAGAKAVLTTSIGPEATVVSGGPAVGFGIGGFGGGYRSGTFGGVGIELPIGGAQVSTGYAANSVLTDVATGRPMWSGKATARASTDVNGQVAELVKAVVTGARQAGLF